MVYSTRGYELGKVEKRNIVSYLADLYKFYSEMLSTISREIMDEDEEIYTEPCPNGHGGIDYSGRFLRW